MTTPAAETAPIVETPKPAAVVQAEPNKDAFKLPLPLSIDDFELGVTLGTGSFGRVKFVTHKATETHWAMKQLKKAEVIRLQQVEHMISEKTILDCLDHPFIVRLSGTFQDKRYLYMMLEYIVGGEFFTHLRKAGRFENSTSKFYAAQIVMIFDYLHQQDFIYRDLKPENLLLDNTGYIKITDFGFAKKVAFKTYTLCGTPGSHDTITLHQLEALTVDVTSEDTDAEPLKKRLKFSELIALKPSTSLIKDYMKCHGWEVKTVENK